jgi:hypothetical protein
MPTFVPNDYLFKTHADKGKEKWEIFAWAIRDVMSKTGNMPLYNGSRREMISYLLDTVFKGSKVA